MAHRTFYPLQGRRSDEVVRFSQMTGGGAADLVNADAAIFGAGFISAGARTGAGVFNLTFRDKFPQGLCPLSPGIVGTTTGLVAIFTAWDPVAGTATVKFSVGSVATDPATTDSIRFVFFVRNSGKN
jgi:hypothetical protein